MIRPLLFGELLFDHFPDGRRVLGGAPFNVAWHLQAFGAAPRLISRVGRDAEGDAILAAMADWEMDVSGIQRDEVHPTGGVRVTLAGGEPRFHILDGQAYDFIDPAQLPIGEGEVILYHGSLALRNPFSRAALEVLRSPDRPVFLDVNLRSPWWKREEIEALLAQARWVKLNGDELSLLEPEAGDREQKAARLLERHGLAGLYLTLGADGALALTRAGERFETGRPPATTVIDTVGAGDAFAAVAILGLIQGWPMAVTLRRAQAFASALVGVRGATLAERGFYETHLQNWHEEDSA